MRRYSAMFLPLAILFFASCSGNSEDSSNEDRSESLNETTLSFQDELKKSVLFDEEKLLKQSLQSGKPMLLYFTGYSCVNCRRIEDMTLSDPDIMDYIDRHFITAALYVDDRTKLPSNFKAHKKLKAANGNNGTMVLETYGDYHYSIERSKFERSSQPYFVILNGDQELLIDADYRDSDIEDFKKFLKRGVIYYNSN